MTSEPSRLTIRGDAFDQATWRETILETEGLIPPACQQQLGTCAELAEDLFRALYKYAPELRPDAEIHPGWLHNRSLVEKAQSMPEYEALRGFTKLDALYAAASASTMLQTVLAEVDAKDLDKWREQAEEAQAQQNQLRELEDALAKQPPPPEGGEASPERQELESKRQELESKVQQAQAAQRDLTKAIQQHAESTTGSMRAAIQSGLKKAAEEARDLQEFASGYGTEPGQLKRVPFKERVELAKRLKDNPKLAQVAREIGRIRRLAFAMQQKRVKKVPNEIVGVTLGDDLQDALTSELALLSDPDLEDQFWLKLTQGALLQHEYHGHEKIGKGPIICCYDGSMSMNGAPEVWAKAVTIVLADLARTQGRDFAAIQFGSKGQLKAWRIVKGKTTEQERLQATLEIAEYWFAGGTDFETPLDEAVRILKESAFKKADVLFVTDGECRVSEEWLRGYNAVKKAKEFRVWGVLIGETPPQVMRQITDACVTALDMTATHRGDLDKGAALAFDNIISA